MWKTAGVEPSGDWYVVTEDSMMATLRRADAEKGYFMTGWRQFRGIACYSIGVAWVPGPAFLMQQVFRKWWP